MTIVPLLPGVIAWLPAIVTMFAVFSPFLVPFMIPVSVVPMVPMVPFPVVSVLSIIPAFPVLSTSISVVITRPVMSLWRTVLLCPIFPFLWEVVICEFPDLCLSVGVVAVGRGTRAFTIFESDAESSFFEIRQSPQFLFPVGEGARLAFLA